MISKNNQWVMLRFPGAILFLTIVFASPILFGHGEHFEISGKPKSAFTLDPEQTKFIDLKIAQAVNKPIEQSLGLNGELQLLPNAQADVSVRISGNVTELYANLGDKVKAAQPLLKVQSLLIGDPPPSVVMNAPMAGIIDARNVNLGQAVAPNTVLFHVSDRSKLIALAKVYEEDLGKIKVGQIAKVHVLSYPQQTFVGKVTLIEPNLDPLTRSVNVQILLNNPKDLLKPGMFIRANIILQENKDALVIPNSAIIEANNEKFVFKKQGNVYEHVIVKTGISDDDYTEILSGLVAGDEVVTQGNRQLYTYWLTGGKPQPTENQK